MKHFARFLSFAFSLVIFTAFVPMSLAQGGISLTPLISDMELERGMSYQRNVKVRSVDSLGLELNLEIYDVLVDPKTHAVSFLPDESKKNTQKSLASWIEPLGEGEFSLVAGTENIVSYQITVPEDAPLGNYYASLNFYYSAAEKAELGNVQVRQSIGSLVLVNIVGDTTEVSSGSEESEDYEISDIVLSPNGKETTVWVDFTNNTLRYVHLKPQLTISDVKGEVYYQKQGKSKRVFPGESFSFREAFPNSYMEAVENLELEYALWDKQQDEKYYSQQISLGGLGGEFSLFWSQMAWWVKVVLGVITLVVLGVAVLIRRRRDGAVSKKKRMKKK
ncbi:MAG: hypothetical protein P1V18_03335 [Candidatus Gracilibacteria bacterium]|nr:hypothetical protein [Candidatus Gracilibacteria bacterium]